MDLKPSEAAGPALARSSLKAYVTPAARHWRNQAADVWQGLTAAEAASLALIDIKCDFKTVMGGGAPVGNKKKTSVCRASWKKDDIEGNLTEAAKAAFDWLRSSNPTYERFLVQHRALLQESNSPRSIPTAQLLLSTPGVEVAARPWLYPRAAFGDTDVKLRLQALGHLTDKHKPSTKASFARKLLSRCQSYQADFPLFALLHDICLARQISGLVKIAAERGIAPDEAASGMQNFSGFWDLERAKLEDMCRQKGMPNLFFTVAPAEWAFPLHDGMFGSNKHAALGKSQAVVAMHMRHVLQEMISQCVLNQDGPCRAPGIEQVREHSLRYEFQGRGTLHVHVVAWVEYSDPGVNLSGRSGQTQAKSPLLSYLETLFHSRVDVQCQQGEHCLLRYVTGYVSKSSDALEFRHQEWSAGQGAPLSQWRQTYRLLCKQAPLEPEMALQLIGAPLMESSFRGVTVYAPLPWNQAKKARQTKPSSQARQQYLAYLSWNRTLAPEAKFGRKLSFLEWFRLYKAIADNSGNFVIKERGACGAGSTKAECAVGLVFSFELLDIFVGQLCASLIPHLSEDEFAMPAEEEERVPEGWKKPQKRRRWQTSAGKTSQTA